MVACCAIAVRGPYRKENLIAQFGPEIALLDHSAE
jgi:hypothetical protein